MQATVFTRARWAVGLATLLTVAAMVRYPGGTTLDHAPAGYSLLHNFLSDLGMTVAYGGQPNALGATLFVLSLTITVVALGGCLLAFVRLYAQSPRSRAWARAAGGVGLLVGAAFVGVGLTPENRMMALHLQLTLLAFRTLPIASLLMVFASLHSDVFPRGVAIAWACLTVVLAGYVVVLGWGPALTTVEGLTIQVVAQKVVTVALVGIFVYLSVEGDRVLARIASGSRPSTD